jgi:hypothetical protein
MALDEEDDAVHGVHVMNISTVESQVKEDRNKDSQDEYKAQDRNSPVEVQDTTTHEDPRLKSIGERFEDEGISDARSHHRAETHDDDSSQSFTNAGPNEKQQGHDDFNEKLLNDDDVFSDSSPNKKTQEPGISRDDVDESNVKEGEDDSLCSKTDSGEQESVWSHDEVYQSNVQDEEEKDEKSEGDDDEDDDDSSYSPEDVPHQPGRPRKEEPPALDHDDESNAQDEEDEEDDDEVCLRRCSSPISTTPHSEKDAQRKPGRPRKQEPLLRKRKRGRPRKQEPPTLDDGDDDYQRGRPKKMLKATKSKRGRPRKTPNETTSKRGRPRKIPKETTKSPMASLKAKPKEEPRREPGTEIGSSVYAKWLDGFYYWAVIVDIKRKPCSHYDQYSVRATV